jgi:IrrE N-terminal-like domain
MRRDHYVGYRSEEEIASIALTWGKAGDISNHGYFDIIDFVQNVLSKQFTKKGALTIRLFDGAPQDDLAYVTFNPLTLHVDSEVWHFAKLGDPTSRHMIAHEIGHALLHDHYARPFSNDPSQNIRFAQQEHSAEWQANTFAGHFLLPDHIM